MSTGADLGEAFLQAEEGLLDMAVGACRGGERQDRRGTKESARRVAASRPTRPAPRRAVAGG
jgi:hypothetical protein